MVDLAKRRDRLQTRIDAWRRKAELYLPLQDEEESWEDMLEDDVNYQSDVDTDDGSLHGDLPMTESDVAGLPELAHLYLPSAMSADRWAPERAKELSLRQGQANDSLHSLRICLGQKSLVFRKQVRVANSQQKKTRAWSELNAIENSVRRYARIYNSARQAMIRLGADAQLLGRYQVLKRSELKVSTVIATPNGAGQRNSHLAWFWTMDVQRDTDNDDWMEECR
jgi:hypothetical protein